MPSTPAQWPARYELLDGLRGLACIGVLLNHLGVVRFGHYCVMVFFVISGYCITASARSAIQGRMPLRRFMWRRVRRIFPPYFLAVLLFGITRLARNELHLSPVVWHASPLEWLQNLTLTQWLSDLWHPVQWADQNRTLFVAAFWSLNYEEQFYLVMGLAVALAIYRSRDLRWSVLTLLVLGMIWDLAHPAGPINGFFLEYWPHFALGACLFFTLAGGDTDSLPRWLFLTLAGVLATLSLWHLLPWRGSATENSERVYVEFAVLSGLSVALVVLRPYSERIARSWLWKPAALVGLISYSLYLIHQFNLTLVSTVVARLSPPNLPSGVDLTAKVLVHVLLATGFWYLFERPFLNRRSQTLGTANALPEPIATIRTGV